MKYRIAVVQVSDALHGLKKDAKMVRVGFIAPGGNGNVRRFGGGGGVQIQPAPLPVPPIGAAPAIMRRPGFVRNVDLQVGQDGMFTVNKLADEKFYVIPSYAGFVSSQNNQNFENDVKTTKQLCKVLENTGTPSSRTTNNSVSWPRWFSSASIATIRSIRRSKSPLTPRKAS